MNCEKYSEWLSLYIDKELEEKDRVIFENHLSNCESCREELEMLKEITSNIKELEMIDPPEGFHNELMQKIKSEQKQEKVIILPIKKNKWYLNLKIASAVAAAFIFSTLLFNPLKTKPPVESLPETSGNMLQSRMIEAPEESFDKEQAQGAAFAMEESSLEINPEMWIIETPKYTEYKETIIGIGQDMGLDVLLVEELGSEELKTGKITMEVVLKDSQKSEFEAIVRSVDEFTNIVIQEEIKAKKERNNNDFVTLVIIINQAN